MVKNWIGLREYLVMSAYFGLFGGSITMILGVICVSLSGQAYLVDNVIDTAFWVTVIAVTLGLVCGLFFKKEKFLRD